MNLPELDFMDKTTHKERKGEQMTEAIEKPSGLLAKVTKGRVVKPHKLIMYGVDGVGKSSFGGDAPKPIFLGPEDGSNSIDAARFPSLHTWPTVMQALTELLYEKHDYQSAVLDSLDWLEPLNWAQCCVEHGVKTIEEGKDFSFGKGYGIAIEKWKEMMALLDRLREEKKMNVIAVAHAKIKKFEDPSTPAGYERYQLKLQDGMNTSAAALWREYADTVLFANFKVYTTIEDKKRGFGDGARVIYTERRPGWDAKNRLGLPFELPLSWAEFSDAASKGEPNSPGVLISQIEGLKTQVKNKDVLPKIEDAIKRAGRDAIMLAAIKNRLDAILGQQG